MRYEKWYEPVSWDAYPRLYYYWDNGRKILVNPKNVVEIRGQKFAETRRVSEPEPVRLSK